MMAGGRIVPEAREMRVPQGDSKVSGVDYINKGDFYG